MGKGHSDAAIEAVNALTGDVSRAKQGRYDRSEAGLSRLAADFYSYAIAADGAAAVPPGSHAEPNTAGPISEGGYLSLAGVPYVPMPLPGGSSVALLRASAFEAQPRSAYTQRWWSLEHSGLAVPRMLPYCVRTWDGRGP